MEQQEDITSRDVQQLQSSYDLNELCRKHGKNLTFFTSIKQRNNGVTRSFLPRVSRLFGISCVYAGGQGDVKNSEKDTKTDSAPSSVSPTYNKALEEVARLYIDKESGWERVKSLFENDHRGKSSEEINVISVALVQVFVITFFCKYVPVIKFARREFIREHQATVFRTRIEAIRRMNDTMFMKAAAEAGWLASKVTLFSASFLLISQMIASYRNKTSVFEYTAASVVTGGLARLNMGIRGILSGSVVGGVIGSAVGLIAFSLLSAYDMTQQDRHLRNIVSKLEVERSVVGDSTFHKKVQEAYQEHQEMKNATSS